MTKNTSNKTSILTLFIIITGAGALSFVLLGNLDYISADSNDLLTGDAVNKLDPVNQSPENNTDTGEQDKDNSTDENQTVNRSEEGNQTDGKNNLTASYSFSSGSESETSETGNENPDSEQESDSSPKPGIEMEQKTTVFFTANDQTGEREYFWDFGDNQTGRGPEIKHEYSPGVYTVKLEVKKNGVVESTKTKEIEISE